MAQEPFDDPTAGPAWRRLASGCRCSSGSAAFADALEELLQTRVKERALADLAFVLLTVGLFVVLAFAVRGVERL